MALFLAFMVVIITFKDKGAENTIDTNRLTSLALLAGLGLVGCIDLVGGHLQQPTHQLVGWLKNRRSNEHFQLLNGHATGLLRLEVSDQLPNFLLVGKEDPRGGVFFFEPAAISSRVSSTI